MERTAFMATLSNKRIPVQQPIENDVKMEKPKSSNRKKRTQTQDRHKRFVKWIIGTFPHVMNDSNDEGGKHILDVASGKGETAARLSMCHQIKVMMIEPRLANVEATYKSKVLSKLPIKWQQRMEAHLVEDPDFISNKIRSLVSHIYMCFTDDTVANSIYLQDALNNSSLLVGLHADNATEAIIDAALQYKLPFVVVPCCVFGNFFPDRTKKDGTHVMSYEDFIEYLLEKDSRFRKETLPFPGRDIAIWWDGKE